MIDFELFLQWAEENFDVVAHHGQEIKVNSIFREDQNLHLWCNPSKNAFHCWKSDESGNLFELVSKVTGCSYQKAVELLSGDNDLRNLEARLEEFYSKKQEKQKEVAKSILFPKGTFLIKSLMPKYRQKAEDYLQSRCLSVDGLFFCISGRYYNRIIIPYYDKTGNLVYWNARDITGKSKMKYMGPDAKEYKIGKGDVLFMTSWPAESQKVYLAEGEFDAMSLKRAGLIGGACGGKELSDKQIEMLRMYKVCMAFDADKSGMEALNKIGDKLISNGAKNVSFVQPPTEFKDWNKMLVTHGERILSEYIHRHEKPFTSWTSNSLQLNK